MDDLVCFMDITMTHTTCQIWHLPMLCLTAPNQDSYAAWRCGAFIVSRCVPSQRSLPSSLVKETQHLASRVLPLSLLVVHDAIRGGQDNVAELAGGQQIHDPLLNVRSADVKPRADHAALVDATNQINDNLAAAVIIDNLELTNVP